MEDKTTFILLLKVIGQIDALDNLLPELPESPYLMRKDEKKAQRIRHTKQKATSTCSPT